MATESPQHKGRDRGLPALDVLIQILEVAKVACVFPPAQVAIGSTSALLMVIRVRSLLLYLYNFPAKVSSGLYGQQTRLHRAWEIMRPCLSSPRPRVKRKTIGRTQPFRPRSDWATDLVSWTAGGPCAEQPIYWGLNCRTVGEIQGKIVAQGKRNPVSRALYARNDKDAIVAWGRNLDRILNIFNVRVVHPV